MWLIEKDSSIHFYIADPTATPSPVSLRCCFIQIFIVRKIMFTVFCSTNVRNVYGYWNAHQACESRSYPCVHENGSKEPSTLCILALFLFISWRGLSGHLWSTFQFSQRNWRTKVRMSMQSGIPRILRKQPFLLALRRWGHTTHKTSYKVQHFGSGASPTISKKLTHGDATERLPMQSSTDFSEVIFFIKRLLYYYFRLAASTKTLVNLFQRRLTPNLLRQLRFKRWKSHLASLPFPYLRCKYLLDDPHFGLNRTCP